MKRSEPTDSFLFPLVGSKPTDSLIRTGKHYYTIAGYLKYSSPGLYEYFWKQQGQNIMPTMFTNVVGKACLSKGNIGTPSSMSSGITQITLLGHICLHQFGSTYWRLPNRRGP